MSEGDVTVLYSKDAREIQLPEGTTEIVEYMFSNYVNLERIIIPDTVRKIGDGAFYGCAALRSITIPGDVTSIGKKAFYGCSALISITIPCSVTSIGIEAFDGCRSLTEIHAERRLEDLPDMGHDGRLGEYLYFSEDGILYVAHYSNRKRYHNLLRVPEGRSGSLQILDGCTLLHSGLRNCEKITTVTIPASVVEIRADFFASCTALTDIFVRTGNQNYSAADGVLYNRRQTVLYFCPRGKRGNYTVPEYVKALYPLAFWNCSLLEEVHLPESIDSVLTLYSGTSEFCDEHLIEEHDGYDAHTFGGYIDPINNNEKEEFFSDRVFGSNLPRYDWFRGCSSLKQIAVDMAENAGSGGKLSSRSGILYIADTIALIPDALEGTVQFDPPLFNKLAGHKKITTLIGPIPKGLNLDGCTGLRKLIVGSDYAKQEWLQEIARKYHLEIETNDIPFKFRCIVIPMIVLVLFHAVIYSIYGASGHRTGFFMRLLMLAADVIGYGISEWEASKYLNRNEKQRKLYHFLETLYLILCLALIIITLSMF